MNVLSLYDGISCGMVALTELGVNVEKYDAYEIDEDAIKISKFNFPNINQKGNVFDAIFDTDYDLLIGGSPCTYWSIAQTKHRETNPDGLGGKLFMEYVRALKTAKPKYFLYENNKSMSKDIKDFITEQLGVKPLLIDSALFSAQHRERLYWTNIPIKESITDYNIFLNDIINWDEEKFRPCGNWVYNKWGDNVKLNMLHDINSKKSHTLTTSGSHPMNYYLNADKTKYCNLSIKDWEKLQTLPAGYVDNVPISKSAKYKGIGNGWTIAVIKFLLKGIKE